MITNVPTEGIREMGPFHERFMRLKFKNRVQSLREERVIATLWGCIKRRLNQKGVKWGDAKSISIHYNEETAEITYMDKMWQRENGGCKRESEEENLEKIFKDGDRCVLTTSKDQTAMVLVAKATPRDGQGERYRLTAHMHVDQLGNGQKEKGILSALEFANVPLEIQKEKEIYEGAQIRWKQMKLFKKTWRPFSLGIIMSYNHEQKEYWWNQKWAEEEEWDKEKRGERVLYAAWPFQAYIEGFERAIGILQQSRLLGTHWVDRRGRFKGIELKRTTTI